MKSANKGFSLIEIMVGLVIGIIGMIVVMQTYSVFEGRKRTTTGGADAQSNAAIALYMMERDIRMSGWGVDANTFAACTSSPFTYCDGSAGCGGAVGPLPNFDPAAAVITDGGNNPDTVIAQYFADPNLGTFRYPSQTALSSSMPQSSSELNVNSTYGCTDGGMALVSNAAGQCTLMQLTTIQTTALKIQHNPGGSGIYNPPASYQNANGWPKYETGATVSCFDSIPTGAAYQRGYAVNTANRQLQRSDSTVTPALVDELIISEVIDMQAQYGIATVASPAGTPPVVNSWVNATGGWAAPTTAQKKQIKAVRIVLVTRSSQYEKPTSGNTCATTSPVITPTSVLATGNTDSWSTWATFDSTNYPADWQCYRYKSFETVIPLRNVMWGDT